jgi:sepiapterin reductase
MGIYAAGKSARNHYHATLAKELEGSTKNSKVLNYAPGPLDTDMAAAFLSADNLNADLKPNFQQQLVDPDDSASKLVELLAMRDFESGQHIDYYDLI